MATSKGLRRFFALAAGLALVAGVLLFALASQTDQTFSWTIEPPLTAAFMGAAYWAALVLLAWAARQDDWVRARTALPAVGVIALLLLVATLIHLDKFDFDSIFGWFWLVVYVTVTPLLAWLVWRQPAPRGPLQGPRRTLPTWLRAALSLQAGAMLGIGAALFVASSDAASSWPWELTPLAARAVGAFLCGFAAAAAFAVRENDLTRLHGAAIAYLTLGALELLATAIHSEDLGDDAVKTTLYVAFWASVLGVGAYGAWASRASAPRSRSAASISR